MLDRLGKSVLMGVSLLTASSGCSEELGPERFTTTRVEGTVRLAGRPVAPGWVEFLPAEGTPGNLRSAPIREDGSFAIDGVPVGRVAIALAGVHGPPIPTSLGPVDLGEFRFFQTPIHRLIPAGAKSRVDLDLAAEAESFRLDRLRLRRQLNDASE